ncbi:hypothetical protein [Streptomyces sp. NBC_00239]|nr:hypothetical protein [Streptomyces sp. NBC_00239]
MTRFVVIWGELAPLDTNPLVCARLFGYTEAAAELFAAEYEAPAPV